MQMRWLLLYIVFDVSSGGMRQETMATRVFASEAACNAEGRRLERTVHHDRAALRSMSICIPESAYDRPEGEER
jgi:hypothetical protein